MKIPNYMMQIILHTSKTTTFSMGIQSIYTQAIPFHTVKCAIMSINV